MKIVECPRDAMQGIEHFIPTQLKADYLNQLLKVGFDTLDFGSFVSSKAIPQLKDTSEVLSKLNLDSSTHLLAIIANIRGAQQACEFDEIKYLGFPLSVSETFQQRNTNKSIEEALNHLSEIQELCVKHDKTLVTYLSMGFGNPYGDPYDESILSEFIDKLTPLNVEIISLADTIGVSQPDVISNIFGSLSSSYPKLEIGVHLHSTPETANEKIEAAYSAGCKRFDGAIRGFGGCPMAEDDLVGNLATEKIIEFLRLKEEKLDINENQLKQALQDSISVFN
ncbi:MAG: hydroxymethylglutaryl-CoA lyase [Bacteroidota bacterium]